MALVVTKWRADETVADQDGNFVAIECRQEGLVSFILSAMGIAPITTIKVGGERVEFTTASLEGYTRWMIPLQGICFTRYGYKRPLSQAIGIGIFSVALGSALMQASGVLGLVVMTLGVGIAVLYYVLNKKLSLDFVQNSGHPLGIQFKRSMIEGKKIEEEDARRVCQIIQATIEARGL